MRRLNGAKATPLLSLLAACASPAGDTSGAPARPAAVVGVPFRAPRCAPGAPPSLVDRSAALGFGAPQAAAEPAPPGLGWMVAEDADADGDVDLIVSETNRARIWEQVGGAFVPRTLPLPGPAGAVPHLALADLDGDGWQDLLQFFGAAILAMPGGAGLDFSPEAAVWHPLAAASVGTVKTLVIGDLDRDGDLDVVAPGMPTEPGGEAPPARVLLQGANGLTEAAQLTDDGTAVHVQVGLATDRDDDGDLDILLVNDLATRSTFWRNDTPAGGALALTEDSRTAGIGLSMAGMGADATDLNGDGLLDYCLSDVGPPRCFLSDGRGAWYDAQVGLAPAAPVGRHGTVGWSVDLADLDLDGQLELAQASSEMTGLPGEAAEGAIYPDLLWSWDGATFTDVTAAWGFGDLVPDVASTVADLDADGLPEVIFASPWAPPRVVGAPCRRGAGLEVRVPGPSGNLTGLGARVEVEAGGRVHVREVHALRSHGQGPARLSFGLGDAVRVDAVRVRWADGAEAEATGLAVDQHITLPHPDAAPGPG